MDGPGPQRARIGVTHEATRRRQVEGVGADRSWRVGADGEAHVGDLLVDLVEPSRWERLRGRAPRWRVLHSVPLDDGRGQARGDIDHVVIGPPGVVTINTKHHRSGRLELDGDTLTVNGRPSDYVRKARLEGLRAAELLRAALADAGQPGPDAQREVRPVIVVVGGRLLPRRWPVGVTVVMGRQLVHTLRSMAERWDPVIVTAVFDIARRSTTWTLRRPPRA